MRRLDTLLLITPVVTGLTAPALLGALFFQVAEFHRGSALATALQLTGVTCATLPLIVLLREWRRSRHS